MEPRLSWASVVRLCFTAVLDKSLSVISEYMTIFHPEKPKQLIRVIMLLMVLLG